MIFWRTGRCRMKRGSKLPRSRRPPENTTSCSLKAPAVSDPYQIRIPNDNWERMSAWPLPPEIRQATEQQLREQLAIDPVRHLVRAIAPWGEPLNLFAFSLPDTVRPTLSHLFQ